MPRLSNKQKRIKHVNALIRYKYLIIRPFTNTAAWFQQFYQEMHVRLSNKQRIKHANTLICYKYLIIQPLTNNLYCLALF
jgi:hypothetical protein